IIHPIRNISGLLLLEHIQLTCPEYYEIDRASTRRLLEAMIRMMGLEDREDPYYWEKSMIKEPPSNGEDTVLCGESEDC
ncbi:hypothetical protein PFISCL1PPCAC_1763, partial [Pristionchus fissidentatus]